MKKEVGLWIDHRHAVIVFERDQEEEVKRVTSNLEKHVRYSDASEASGDSNSHNNGTEDGRDRRFDDQMNRYYDEVILELGDVNSILIMGPGEAKIELQKRLELQGLANRTITIQAADKLTDNQIVKEVKQYFHDVHHGSKKTHL